MKWAKTVCASTTDRQSRMAVNAPLKRAFLMFGEHISNMKKDRCLNIGQMGGGSAGLPKSVPGNLREAGHRLFEAQSEGRL